MMTSFTIKQKYIQKQEMTAQPPLAMGNVLRRVQKECPHMGQWMN